MFKILIFSPSFSTLQVLLIFCPLRMTSLRPFSEATWYVSVGSSKSWSLVVYDFRRNDARVAGSLWDIMSSMLLNVLLPKCSCLIFSYAGHSAMKCTSSSTLFKVQRLHILFSFDIPWWRSVSTLSL